MSRNTFARSASAVLAALILLLSGWHAPIALASAGQQQKGGITLGYNPDNGRLIFVGTDAGYALASEGDVSAMSVEENGLGFINAYASQLGLSDPAQELQNFKTSVREDGRTVIRYRQVYQGVPVFGAETIVNVNAEGALMALSSKVSPGLSLDTQPALAADESARIALQAIAKWYEADESLFTLTEPELWIYDENLFFPSLEPPRLVWKLEVDGTAASLPVREVVLVDAQRGGIAVHYNRIDTLWTGEAVTSGPAADSAVHAPTMQFGAFIEVYDMDNKCLPGDGDCSGSDGTLPGTLICSSPSCSSSDPDAQDAFEYASDTYWYYANKHGRDSIDDAGMTLVLSVHYGTNYQNAYWNGTQMVFGDDMAVDDVTGHEITHGVTDDESDLVYMYQPGAINESLSDVFGEFIDLDNGESNPANRWMIGEDSPLGILRDMENPPAYGDPDKMTSTKYYVGESDHGGVHQNSGVNNKAVFLMTDGGTFNSKTVTGLGRDSVSAIYYEAQTNLLGAGSNYLDLYYILYQACQNLVGTNGIDAADCQEVRDATDAVEMNKTKSATFYPTADFCPSGTKVGQVLFADDMEIIGGNWDFYALSGDSMWTHILYYASSGDVSLYGDQGGSENDSVAEANWAVSVPTGAKTYLRFDHDFSFESNGTTNWDGGVLEYALSPYTTWVDISSKFSAGANYNGTINAPLGNALNGRKGFVQESHGYVSSRYELSSFAGKNITFRWRTAVDWAGRADGWYVDDVQVYTCVSMPSVPALSTPANNALLTDLTPKLDWGNSTPDLDHYQVQIATNSGFSAIVYDEEVSASEFTVPSNLNPATTYYWHVRSYNVADETKGWTSARTFRMVIGPPASLGSPANGASLLNNRPTFTWSPPSSGTPSGYTIQVSKSNTFSSYVINKTATGTSYTPSTDLPANTLLYWRVIANHSTYGPSAPTSARTLTTANPPAVPGLLAPTDKALVNGPTVLLDWSLPTVPTGTSLDYYDVQVAYDSAFQNMYFEGVQDYHEFNLDVPYSEITLYWRVRAYNTLGHYSAWSAVRSFNMAIGAPIPYPVDPLNPGTNTLYTNRPTFSWDSGSMADSYTLQVSKYSNYSSPVVNATVPGGTYFTIYTIKADLPANTTLYWRVRSNKAVYGPSAWANGASFTSANPPSIPTLSSPAANALVSTTLPFLNWNNSTVPAGTTFRWYEIQVDTSDWFGTAVSANTTEFDVNNSQFTTVLPLENGATYYWRVRSWNTDDQYSSWSAVRSFRVYYAAPINLNATSALKPTFTWDPIPGATSYTLQVSQWDTFTALTFSKTVTVPNYTHTVNLKAGSTYYWRVRANGTYGPGAWSITGSFTTP